MRLRFLVLTVVVLGMFLSYPTNVGVLIDAPLTMKESMHFSDDELGDYEIVDPIIITTERSFELTGWSGSGTFEDPYLLEQVHITSNGDGPFTDALRISDVDCYFIVRNCIFSGINRGGGFRFRNLAHATIVNCIFNGAKSGILLYNCNNTKILNNTIIGEDGIQGYVSANVEIANNCVRNARRGIVSEVLHDVSISNNTILYSGYGIHHLGENGTIIDNIIAASETVGIMIDDRWGNNTIYGNQIGFSGEFNARDESFGEENMWDDGESMGNSWSDLGNNVTYTISGEAGSVDRYPSHFTIDILGPVATLEFHRDYENILDMPDNSFTFQAEVSDNSGVDTVLLYTRYSEGESVGWTVHEMHRNTASSNIYQCTVSGLRTGNIDFYVWANDTLGNWDTSYIRVVWVEVPGQRFVDMILPFAIFGVAVVGLIAFSKVLSRKKRRGKETQDIVTVRKS